MDNVLGLLWTKMTTPVNCAGELGVAVVEATGKFAVCVIRNFTGA